MQESHGTPIQQLLHAPAQAGCSNLFATVAARTIWYRRLNQAVKRHSLIAINIFTHVVSIVRSQLLPSFYSLCSRLSDLPGAYLSLCGKNLFASRLNLTGLPPRATKPLPDPYAPSFSSNPRSISFPGPAPPPRVTSVPRLLSDSRRATSRFVPALCGAGKRAPLLRPEQCPALISAALLAACLPGLPVPLTAAPGGADESRVLHDRVDPGLVLLHKEIYNL